MNEMEMCIKAQSFEHDRMIANQTRINKKNQLTEKY